MDGMTESKVGKQPNMTNEALYTHGWIWMCTHTPPLNSVCVAPDVVPDQLASSDNREVSWASCFDIFEHKINNANNGEGCPVIFDVANFRKFT